MKVLLSALACSPGVGSEPSTGWNWANALADLGHQVTVLVMSNHREEVLAAARHDIDFRFIEIPTTPLPKFTQHLWTADIINRWQDAALRHVEEKPHDYDVVHHVTWGSLHLNSVLWRLKIPMVLGPIGGGQTAPANYWRYFGRDWPVETLRTAVTGPLLKLNHRSRDAVRHSAVTLVCNSATAAASRRLGATDVRFMLADGLRPDWLGSARVRPTGTPIVLWVGRLLSRKAPILAVRAFAELRRAMPARLIMAGDGPLRGQVRSTIDSLGLSQDVQLLGPVKWDDVKDLYDSASVLLFTSLRESFGAPFLEALGRGLPAVALDLHGIGDADVGPAALKVPLPPAPRELPARLGSALETVLSDGEWESRSAAAVKWADQWTWPVKAATITQLYQEIVAPRG
jgi:glycosyltransferase involved in cell wall biosynthesis